MQTLEKRIAALETKTVRAADITMIRRFVSPGCLDAAIHHLRDANGGQWERKPDETEQELIDRASMEVKRTPWGVACLAGYANGVPHAAN